MAHFTIKVTLRGQGPYDIATFRRILLLIVMLLFLFIF